MSEGYPLAGRTRRPKLDPTPRRKTAAYYAILERKKLANASKPIRGARLASMEATHSNFQRRLEEFWGSLKGSLIAGKPPFVWMESQDPLACEIRILTLCLWHWPAPYAPWGILEECLDKVQALVTKGV